MVIAIRYLALLLALLLALALLLPMARAAEAEWQAHMNAGAIAYQRGDYRRAATSFAAALKEAEALGEADPRFATTINNLALMFMKEGRYAEAEPLYRRSLAVHEKALGPDHPSVGTTLNNLAGLFEAQGRYAEAEPLYRRTLSINEKALGPDHPSVGTTLGNLAFLYRRQQRWEEGLGLARRATQSLAARFDSRDDAGRAAVLAEQRTRAWNFELHVSLLRGAAVSDAAAAAAAAEALEVAQLARATDTAEQLARMSARHASASDARAMLARGRQDLIARLQQIESRSVQAAARAPKDRDAASEARLREEGAAARKSLAALDERMASEFPDYVELANPRPVALAGVQKLLGADEAMAVFLVSHEESFLWVLRRDALLWERLVITRRELDAMVRKLRAQLDLGGDDPARILSRPFDTAAAHELYVKLFAPGEKLLAGVKHLLVVPDGALTSLPPAVLVTEKAAGQPAWLARKYAVTVLPSVGSLRALRAFAKAQPAAEPFIGFGDPLLEGGADARRTKVAALYSRGAVADTREVRKLARLPETADELKAIAATLKAPGERVRLGAQATEKAVKETDLSRSRTIAFATHGLMAGDFKGLAEPALVLTPPETGSDLDDGLLTAGEISQLKLNADWMILSACNTAAPDGTPGADGLSGLAKAFFYAGARSLLVSHWAVSSEATVALTTRMFAESERGAGNAEALRLSMLALMQTPGKPHFAHPAFWAPFVVVGEGNAEWSVGGSTK